MTLALKVFKTVSFFIVFVFSANINNNQNNNNNNDNNVNLNIVSTHNTQISANTNNANTISIMYLNFTKWSFSVDYSKKLVQFTTLNVVYEFVKEYGASKVVYVPNIVSY